MRCSIKPTIAAFVLTAIAGLLIGLTSTASITIASFTLCMAIAALFALSSCFGSIIMLFATRESSFSRNNQCLLGALVSTAAYGLLLLLVTIYFSIVATGATVVYIFEMLFLIFVIAALVASIVEVVYTLACNRSISLFE